jgi:thiosulfate/3-mercaptopyruvate sulfurtransferase
MVQGSDPGAGQARRQSEDGFYKLSLPESLMETPQLQADSPLIEPEDLARHIHDPAIVVVDCRYDLFDPAAGRRDYDSAHIPGARYADLASDLSRASGPRDGRHPLPDRAEFARRLGALGIDAGSEVIVYDEGPGAVAARLWWMLGWIGHERCRLLNGGLRAWTMAGQALERSTVHWPVRNYQRVDAFPERVIDSDALPDFLGRGGLLIDARAPTRYRGEQEPIDPVAGHVPGAVNVPFSANLEPGGRFLEPDALRRRYGPLLAGHEADQVAAMCGSGVTACHTLLALRIAGFGAARLFAGSWSEWIRDPARPVATGDEAAQG